MTRKSDVVLLVGSGPNALLAQGWPKDWFDKIVVINNAWRVRPDWDDLIFPEDFAIDKRPAQLGQGQRMIEADLFVPAQNRFGGFVFAGGTMAFTAAYWALDTFKPKVMAFVGCDMVYAAQGDTHFYGNGVADPLRDDVTLRDLGAKSARLGAVAAHFGCHCVNLSMDLSELVFPRVARAETLRSLQSRSQYVAQYAALRARESALGYDTPTGRYWEDEQIYDQEALAALDRDWRAAFAQVLET